MTLIAIVMLVVIGLLVVRSIVLVPRDAAYVVERLGRLDRVLTEGLHVVPVFMSRVTARVPTGHQVVDVPPTPCTTLDGHEVTCSGTVTFRVVDASAAVSNVADYRQALTEVAAQEFARAIVDVEAVAAPAAPSDALADLQAAAARFGLDVVSVEPRVTLSEQAEDALSSLVAAARDERVARWAAERGEPLGVDGRPTDEQRTAYDEWLALEVRIHAREIEAARRRAEAGLPEPGEG